MATSGTVGQTTTRVADICESMIRRCGGEPAHMGPEVIQILLRNLYFTLSQMSTRGVNLWRQYRPLIANYSGQGEYTMADGDIDIAKLMYRQPMRLSASTVTSSAGGTADNVVDADIDTACTQTSTNGNLVFDWGSGSTNTVALVGILSYGAATYTLTFSISNDGITYTTVKTITATAYAAGEWNWYAVEPAGVASRYFKIAETGGATLNLAEVSLAAQWNDIEVARIDQDTFQQYSNKRAPGQPRQYWFNRQTTPVIVSWPVPNNTFNLFAPLVHRHIEDVGTLQNTLDIPQRWYQAIVTYAAYMSFLELPKEVVDMQRFSLLEKQALAVSLPDAESEESDSAPLMISPNIGVYTR